MTANAELPSLGLVGSEATPDDPRIASWVDALLRLAIRQDATEVHLEPFERVFRVRVRAAGTLAVVTQQPMAPYRSLVGCFKSRAGLPEDPNAAAQSGKFSCASPGSELTVALHTLSTIWGESVALRIFNPQPARPFALESLGFEARNRDALITALAPGPGLVVIAGGMRSGKSTTLYACLRRLVAPDRVLVTAETHVEENIDGVHQVRLRPEIGLNTAVVLRASSKPRPDAILIENLLTFDAIECAVRAAVTGSLVLAGMAVRDVPSALDALLDSGVEPYLLGAVLRLVHVQRLLPAGPGNGVRGQAVRVESLRVGERSRRALLGEREGLRAAIELERARDRS